MDKSNFKKGPSNIKTKEQCQKCCEKENDLFACSFLYFEYCLKY